jgi:hypothetical protein
MKALLLFPLSAALVLSVPAQSAIDWFFLVTGDKIPGTFEGGAAQSVRVRSLDGTVRDYDRASVAWIGFSPSTPSAATQQAPAPTVTPPAPSGTLAECMQSLPPSVPANTGSSIPSDQAALALEFHNCARRQVGAPPLQWSTQLAAAAQRWAQHLAGDEGCNLVHTQNDSHGENLFGGSGKDWTPLEASKDWYSEIKLFHYGPLTEDNWHAAGHYTQMIWKNTTQVGMGKAHCANGGLVIVAEYNPPGNVMGEAPY